MKWEYRIIDTGSMGGHPIDSEQGLNDIGEQGWELVTIMNKHYGGRLYYFKRKIKDASLLGSLGNERQYSS